MGIRYYAYAFDADLAQQAVDDPHSILSSDPLADAWGLEPHASVSVATFEQVSPKRDMLYLDKAWSALQSLTRSGPGSPAAGSCYRMFEGNVTMHVMGWDPWVRTILPEEVPAIRTTSVRSTRTRRERGRALGEAGTTSSATSSTTSRGHRNSSSRSRQTVAGWSTSSGDSARAIRRRVDGCRCVPSQWTRARRRPGSRARSACGARCGVEAASSRQRTRGRRSSRRPPGWRRAPSRR